MAGSAVNLSEGISPELKTNWKASPRRMWLKVKRLYIANRMPISAIAEEFGISVVAIMCKAHREGWDEQAKALQERTMQRIADQYVDDAGKQVKELLITWGQIIHEARQHLGSTHDPHGVASLKSLDHAANILDTATKNLRLLAGDESFKPKLGLTWNDIVVNIKRESPVQGLGPVAPRFQGLGDSETLDDLIVDGGSNGHGAPHD